ncbi:MAG: hypothetical protein OXF88_05000 [Rhodobacteraceae bacterium]|nr:hypothetical protein [Paracoccaceae bacterium]MCY4138884.1 hypothetical protein [Paracoccaceae bacterium]
MPAWTGNPDTSGGQVISFAAYTGEMMECRRRVRYFPPNWVTSISAGDHLL